MCARCRAVEFILACNIALFLIEFVFARTLFVTAWSWYGHFSKSLFSLNLWLVVYRLAVLYRHLSVNVSVFSQPCYNRGTAQIYSKALTRELSTFANVRVEIRWFWRERSLLTMKFVWGFYWILKRKVYLTKKNSLPKHHGAEPQRRGAQCSCIGLRLALVVLAYLQIRS